MTQTSLLSAEKAKQLILTGNAYAGMVVDGHLKFARHEAQRLTTLPDNLKVRCLSLLNCSKLKELPRGLRCNELIVKGAPITTLPDDIQVTFRLDLSLCDMLESLPKGLKVGTLILRGCTSLRFLPEGLDVWFLDMPGCVRVTEFPTSGPATMGRLNIRGCTRLHSLPIWLKKLSQLDVSGTAITELPEDLHIISWLDLADTGIQSLPPALQHVHLRWRSVAIDTRIAFRPETIESQEILDTTNAELRRVMLERVGYDRFLEQVNAEELDRDQDAGGERRLLRVPLQNDEPLVGLAVRCPSTGRRYLLRVPPKMSTCHQAAAWIAGFDDPEQYRPLAET